MGVVQDGVFSLELNSQIQLLSRIQYVTRFNSNLIQIIGELGSGKTWLAECYLDKWAHDSIQVFLMCSINQQDFQCRSVILRQIIPDTIFNQQDTLLQSIENKFGDDALQLLIVVDDAHRLSTTIIDEMWELVTAARKKINWQVNILFFSLSNKLVHLFQEKERPEQAPIELEINPLTDEEARQFIKAMIERQGVEEASQEAIIDRAMSSVPKNPGELVQFKDIIALPVEEKRQPRKQNNKVVIIGSAIVVLLFGAAGGMYFYDQTKPPSITNESELPIEIQQEIISDPSFITVEDDLVLLDEPNAEVAAVGQNEVQEERVEKRVIVPSEVVDSIVEKSQLIEQATTKPPTTTDTSQSLKSAENQKTQTLFSLDNALVAGIPASHYAVQLAALQSKAEVNTFIQQYDLKGSVMVYETMRSNKPWFMVLSGDYNSIQAARNAITKLPVTLRKQGAWAKSFAKIHQEAALVK